VVAITGDEESNILISLLAKELGTPKAITRVSKLSYLPLMSAIGINTVVSPRLAAVRAILQYIRPGKILSVAPLKGEHAEAIEAEALETSDIVNKPLHRIKIPKGVIVGAIFRRTRSLFQGATPLSNLETDSSYSPFNKCFPSSRSSSP
jgi:trk system potassium uptake protein TrkA